jgi:Fur family ferric uptake transcriptional regulator
MQEATGDALRAVVEAIRAGGGRVTTSRMVVIAALVGGPGHHVTAHELTDRIRRDHPEFHESTVYRTLDLLVALGVVTRIEGDGGPAVFHVGSQAHHHVVCDRCGRVVGIDADLLAPLADHLRTEHAFELRGDAVTLPGRCTTCPPGPSATATGTAPVHDH